MNHLDLKPVTHMRGSVRLPGSKSISNRILLLAALASGDTRIQGLLDADDVDRMLEALATLGILIERVAEPGAIVVHGASGAFPVKRASLFLGNAGHGVPAIDGCLGPVRRRVRIDRSPAHA